MDEGNPGIGGTSWARWRNGRDPCARPRDKGPFPIHAAIRREQRAHGLGRRVIHWTGLPSSAIVDGKEQTGMTSETINGNLYTWAFDDLFQIARRRRRVFMALCVAALLVLSIAASVVWQHGQLIQADPAAVPAWINVAFLGSLAVALLLADRFAISAPGLPRPRRRPSDLRKLSHSGIGTWASMPLSRCPGAAARRRGGLRCELPPRGLMQVFLVFRVRLLLLAGFRASTGSGREPDRCPGAPRHR